MTLAATIREIKTTAVWIGSATHADFQRPFGYLHQRCTLRLANDLNAVTAWANVPHYIPPEVIFLAENYPLQFSRDEIDKLRSHWPLSGWVHVVSDWSEGEPRTGTTISGAIRIAARELPLWIESELAMQAAGKVASWSQPHTFSREENWSYKNPAQNRVALPVLVVSQRREQFAALAESIESLGHQIINDTTTQPTVIIGNICGDVENALREFEPLCNRWPNARWVLLVDFPRPQDFALAETWGCDTILPKPFSLVRLESALKSSHQTAPA